MGITITPELIAKVVSICAAIGILMPHLQAVIQKPSWSPRAKALLSVGLAVVGGLAAYVVTNGLDFTDPVKIALWISGAYVAIGELYARLWRPLGTTEALEHGVNGDEQEADEALIGDGAAVG